MPIGNMGVGNVSNFRWRSVARSLSLLGFSLGSLAAASAGEGFHSGIYEGLMLAVDPAGDVTGVYREAQGEGVTKTCSFDLFGKASQNAAPVTTRNTQAFPGQLAADDKAVTLKIEKGREHPGCGLVLLPEIAEGLSLDLTAATDWTQLRRIVSPRAYFYADAAGHDKTKVYVVSGDIVGVTATEGPWLKVEYWRDGARKAAGWIGPDDSKPIGAP